MAKSFYFFGSLILCFVAVGVLYETAPLISHVAAYVAGAIVTTVAAQE